jgi:endonuclease-3
VTRTESLPPAPASRHASKKKPFDIDDMMRRLRTATRSYEKAAMFVLADEGFESVFEILVACIISIRTFEEVTLPTARKLFAVARTPAQIAKLSSHQIDKLIHACTFHEPKSKQIHDIAARCVKEFRGELPADRDVLLSFHGVGPKCANLALGIAVGKPFGVPVDIHVHRITNRWGYVSAATPEQTMMQLEQKLPRRYWMPINKYAVPFGKHVCTGKAPRCSECPLLAYCRQVGVGMTR